VAEKEWAIVFSEIRPEEQDRISNHGGKNGSKARCHRSLLKPGGWRMRVSLRVALGSQRRITTENKFRRAQAAGQLSVCRLSCNFSPKTSRHAWLR
jgi:hypothetical protein